MGADAILLIAASSTTRRSPTSRRRRSPRTGGAGRGARRARARPGASPRDAAASGSTTATCALSRPRSRRRCRPAAARSGRAARRQRERASSAGRRATPARRRRPRLPRRRGLHARAGSGLGAGEPRRMKASDLDAAFASLPPPWAAVCRAGPPNASRPCSGASRPPPAIARSRLTTRFAPCVSSRPPTSRSWSSARTRTRRRVMPTAWPFPRAVAGRARWRAYSRCWPPTARVASGRRRLEARRLGAPRGAAAESGPDRRGRSQRQPCGVRLAGAHSGNRRAPVPPARARRSSCSGARKRRSFFAAAAPGSSVRTLETRHPSYDFLRDFMAERQSFRGDLRPRRLVGNRPAGARPCYSLQVRLGGVPEWLKGADCKSVGLRLRWFESSLLHQTSTPSLSRSVFLAARDAAKPPERE